MHNRACASVLMAPLKGPEGGCPRGKGSRGRVVEGKKSWTALIDFCQLNLKGYEGKKSTRNSSLSLSLTQKETCQGKIGPSEQFGPPTVLPSNARMMALASKPEMAGELEGREWALIYCWQSHNNSRMGEFGGRRGEKAT